MASDAIAMTPQSSHSSLILSRAVLLVWIRMHEMQVSAVSLCGESQCMFQASLETPTEQQHTAGRRVRMLGSSGAPT